MFNPFLEVGKLTDKELIRKIEEVTSRIIKARMAGIEYEIIKSMQGIILTCEDELNSRLAKKQMEEFKKEDPCIFQSDAIIESEYQDESTKKPINRPEW